VFTIVGGKLTTWRAMAAEMTDQLVKALGHYRKASRKPSETVPLPGGETQVFDGFRAGGLELGLAEATVDHLLSHFGAETPAIYKLCRERPVLTERLHPEHPAIGAEVIFAAAREFAMTVDDVLARRLHLTTETRDHGAAAVARVSALLGSPRRDASRSPAAPSSPTPSSA
jgi:glycerol-3-phosphate dehydrogenase